MRTKATIAVQVAVVVFYAGFIGFKGLALLDSGEPVGRLLGVALLVMPLLGLYVVWREVEFGRRTAVLARTLDAERGLPVDELPRRPSGRVDRRAATALFEQMREATEANPDDWRSWFRLALAYDAAGDRTRARAAARHAIELHAGLGR